MSIKSRSFFRFYSLGSPGKRGCFAMVSHPPFYRVLGGHPPGKRLARLKGEGRHFMLSFLLRVSWVSRRENSCFWMLCIFSTECGDIFK